MGGIAGCTGDSPQTGNESPTDTPTTTEESGGATPNDSTQTEETDEQQATASRDMPDDLAELEDALTGWFKKKSQRWNFYDNSQDNRVHFEPTGTTKQGGTEYTMFNDFWITDDLETIKEEDRRKEWIYDDQTPLFFFTTNTTHPAVQKLRPKNRDPDQYQIVEDRYRFQNGDDINPPYAEVVIPPTLPSEIEQAAKEEAPNDREKQGDIIEQKWIEYFQDPDHGLQIVLED